MPQACCDVSVALEEPIDGTAIIGTRRWLMVQVSEAWASKAIDAPSLSGPVRAHIESALQRMPDCRLQLIRAPGAQSGGRLMAAVVNGSVFGVTLDSLDGLLGVDLESIFDGVGMERVHEPLTLVCTHGMRDQCCAREGAPVINALRDLGVEQVWATTHLGGHRFAATLVCLPQGAQFGRIKPHEVERLVEGIQASEIFDMDRFRGRTDLSREAQVAEAHLRRREGLTALDAVVCEEDTAERIAFQVNGRTIEVHLRASAHPEARRYSCGVGENMRPSIFSVACSG